MPLFQLPYIAFATLEISKLHRISIYSYTKDNNWKPSCPQTIQQPKAEWLIVLALSVAQNLL
jgi:hypothetical protein